eukprot:TRINITY_DN7631_c0_g1_i1.p2 TRINITY_DN7631_c0_g1~~TRINITY_DN7631_c0_g1_i1.p2  ORF type:complete len:480 (+),score=169.39 TRINITY_DN7631_c0_g1_i1:51-1490(+)
MELPTILCCACGTPIRPNDSNMCTLCLQGTIDITRELQADGCIGFCKHCERYLQPPKCWVQCELESKELLTICLKRMRNLARFHLIDAAFVWTEPHSKRLKVKVTVQKEVYGGTVVQQGCVVEFVVAYQMCDHCQKQATGTDIWVAKVQARQKVDHKRTFLYLEQLLLKSRMHENCTKITEVPDGLDFWFGHVGHARTMVDYLGSVAPTRFSHAEELVSHDSKSNTAEIHHVFCVEIATICRDDLVCLPAKFHQSMGGLGPLCLCLRINANIVLIDPQTVRGATIPAALYWKHPFDSLCAVRHAIEFYVLDIDVEHNAPQNGRFVLAEAQVCRASEVGRGPVYCCKTHLGNVLNVGDTAMGYLLGNINCNTALVEEHRRLALPDVVLVSRSHARAPRRRGWKLRTLEKAEVVGKQDSSARLADQERLFQDLERDPELRAHVQLYRDATAPSEPSDDEDDAPRVPASELICEDSASELEG